jgi:hypothetical protein
MNGQPLHRHLWLYLAARGWGGWAEGWSLLKVDQVPPIWVNEEGVLNKAIRIVCMWGLILAISSVIGLLKVALEEQMLTFEKYITRNIAQTCEVAFYFTLQDIAFVIAIPITNPAYHSTTEIASLLVAVVFIVLAVGFMVWSFYKINYPSPGERYH